MYKKNIRTLVAQLIPITIVVVIAILCVTRFIDKNGKMVQQNNSSYMKEIARQKTEQVNRIFTDDLSSIRSYAHMYGMAVKNSEVDVELLEELEQSSGFDYVRFVDTDGMNYSTAGTAKDCSDRDYYIEGMKDKCGITAVIASRNNGETMVGFYAPIKHKSSIIGVLVGFLSQERMMEELTSYFHEYKGTTLIFDSERNIVAASFKEMQGMNILSLFNADGMISEGERQKAKENMTQGGIVELSFQGDYGKTFVYMCSLENVNWRLIQSFPSAVNAEMAAKYNLCGTRMLITLVGTLILYGLWTAIYFGVSWKKSSRIMKENNLQQLEMIQVLSRNFTNVYCVDLKQNRMIPYRVDKDTPSYFASAVKKKISYDEMCKRYIVDCVYERDQEKLTEVMKLENVMKKLGEQDEFQVDYRRVRDGKILYYMMKCAKVGKKGQSNKLILGFANVDQQTREGMERKLILEDALTKAEKSNQAQTRFLANMSHDIRTPMNAVLGFAQIAKERVEETDRVKDCLEKVVASGNHLMGIIDDIWDMSRLESGRVVVQESESSIAELVHNVVSIMASQMKEKNIDFQVQVQDIENEMVYMDAVKISRILLNILGNAQKYTPEGNRVYFGIRQKERAEKETASYEFVIRDTGVGIAPEFMDKIFVPFEREQNSTQSRIDGTGLGMAIAKNMLDMMNGSIQVKSTKGEGTEFTVNLDLKISSKPMVKMDMSFVKKLRVLVIDKDMDTIEGITCMLEKLGMTVDWSTSSKESILRVKNANPSRDPYRMCIVGMDMEDMDGLSLVEKIKEIPNTEDLAIVAMVNEWNGEEGNAKNVGVEAFCLKPLFMTDILRVIKKIDPLKVKKDKKKEKKKKDYTGKHILLVEDVVMNQKLAKMIFTEKGMEVDVANNGVEAVEMFENAVPGTYDLVFMDLMMPVMDGLEATRRIRALNHADAKRITIVAMTANAFEEDRKSALESGMNDHITKPIKMPELDKILENYLDRMDN